MSLVARGPVSCSDGLLSLCQLVVLRGAAMPNRPRSGWVAMTVVMDRRSDQ